MLDSLPCERSRRREVDKVLESDDLSDAETGHSGGAAPAKHTCTKRYKHGAVDTQSADTNT